MMLSGIVHWTLHRRTGSRLDPEERCTSAIDWIVDLVDLDLRVFTECRGAERFPELSW